MVTFWLYKDSFPVCILKERTLLSTHHKTTSKNLWQTVGKAKQCWDWINFVKEMTSVPETTDAKIKTQNLNLSQVLNSSYQHKLLQAVPKRIQTSFWIPASLLSVSRPGLNLKLTSFQPLCTLLCCYKDMPVGLDDNRFFDIRWAQTIASLLSREQYLLALLSVSQRKQKKGLIVLCPPPTLFLLPFRGD